jgi:hypothetical protein
MQELYSCLGEDVTEAETKLRQQGNDKDLKTSFIGYGSCVQQIIAELENVVGLQDKIVSTGGLLGGLLSVSERNSIRDEVVKAKNIFNLHVRDDNASNDLRCIFDPMLFQNLVIAITTACPTITNILEQLVLASNTGRNVIKTETMKMKAAVHLLASLLDIRD